MVLFGNGGRNARLIGTALLLITFIAGGLAGAAVVRVVSAENPRGERSRPAPEARGGARRVLLDEQFARDVGLSNEQRTRIRTILDNRDAEAKRLWDGFEPRLHTLGQQVHQDIDGVLTVEQRAKFMTALKQRRENWKKQRRACETDHEVEMKREKSQ